MPKYTKSLNLYEFDYTTDNAKTTAFNVGIFLNDNWDKIDNAVSALQANIVGIARLDLIIPPTGWQPDTSYPYHCDIVGDPFTASTVPLLTILPESMAVAQDCGMASCAQTLDGILRVYAETIPTVPIHASLALLGVKPDIDSGATGGVYDITVATPEEAQEMMQEVFEGNVPAGDSIQFATPEDASEMFDEVLGGG